jgi:hypothetical protein
MSTTYYPGSYAPAQPFDRTHNRQEFGYDGSRRAPQHQLPAAMPQPARPSPTSSGLRKGVVVVGLVAALGAGALLGATLFGEDGSDSTSPRPVNLVPRTNSDPAALPTPTSVAPAAAAPEGVALPGVTSVYVPPAEGGPIVDVPPAANPNPAPAPNLAPASNPAAVQQAPRPILVPFPVKTQPEPPKPAPPAPPKPDPPAPGPTGPVGPKGPGDSEYVLEKPPPPGPQGPGDTEVVLPKPGPKGPGDSEYVLPKPVPAPPATVPAPPEPPCVQLLLCY